MLLTAAILAQVTGLSDLRVLDASRTHPAPVDWLVTRAPVSAAALRSADGRFLFLDNGLLRRSFLLLEDGEGGPGGSILTTELLDLAHGGEALIRATAPEAVLTLDGEEVALGGAPGQPDGAFVDPLWLESLDAPRGGPVLVRVRSTPIAADEEGEGGDRWGGLRFVPGEFRHAAPDAAWPPPGVELALDFEFEGIAATVHYALFDHLPAYAKWVTVTNQRDEAVVLDSIVTETLRVVEHSSWVETRGVPLPSPSLHVETDYAFGGMTYRNANHHVVHWREDPTFLSQVNYERTTPCLLEVSPDLGPAHEVAPGATFTSYRTYVLAQSDADGRERQGLARRRLTRTVAPWVTENPLMMHVRWSDWDTVKAAIDQCAEVGFEMVILTFGSGFNIEDRSPEYIAEMKRYAGYAARKGVEIGGYSLLSSRRIEPAGDNCVHPETGEPGADIHGNCPSLTSEWGQRYFDTLRTFYEETGFKLLEHDGSYPGTPDDKARPPLQSGLANSVWAQWRVIDDFYRWCRGKGVYLNVPDHYYHAGANKCGMGYREVNWSLPRAAQVIHTRQNIYDGTWTKTPSMGWMFVPLTEYQGGGAAATIEPLSEHLDHYRLMMQSNLAFGVQACYRGPRLYDTDETRLMVKETVEWFKEHRRLLEADVVHGRRADGRQLDWMLHVDPFAPDGEAKGMLVAFNPADTEVTRTLDVPLALTGIRGSCRLEGPSVSSGGGAPVTLDGTDARVKVTLPPRAMGWVLFSDAR